MASSRENFHFPNKDHIAQSGYSHSVSAASKSASNTLWQTAPNLDTLPDELLHQIFLEDLELNLTLTCRKIKSSLPPFSYAARRLVLLAFCRVDIAGHLRLGQHCGRCSPGLKRPLNEDDRKRLQKKVLEGGWLTMAMLKMAMAAIQEAYVQACWIDTDIRTLPPFEEALQNRWKDDEGVLGKSLDLYGVGPNGVRCLKMHDAFYIELENSKKLDIDSRDRFNVLQVDYIPDKLLEVPVTESKFEFLYFLWRARLGASEWDMEYSTPAMGQAMQYAIATGKLSLTCLLLDLRLRSTFPVVTVEDYLTAARYDHSDILKMLVGFDCAHFPRENTDVKQWVRTAAAKGDKFGQAMLEYMQTVDTVTNREPFIDIHPANCIEPPSPSKYSWYGWCRAQAVLESIGKEFGMPWKDWYLC